jgi:hypothetical protein
VVIALAITWLLSNRRDFTFAIWFWVAIMAYQACYAIAHGGQGSGGVLGDENDLAMGLNTALHLPLSDFASIAVGESWAVGSFYFCS